MSEETPKPEEAEPKAAGGEASVDAASSEAASDGPERPRKKKKKKSDAEADAAAADPRAVAIAAAFEAGNFQRVRELATELTSADDAALRAIGTDYATRIAVDPIQIAFLGLCAVALLTIAWIYVPH